jgi:ABC-type nitrate/sulfonate/bicarbonate transport system permease component
MHDVSEKLADVKVRRAIELAIGPILLIAVWSIAFKGQFIDKDLLPSPIDTLRDTASSIVSWQGGAACRLCERCFWL